MVTTQDVERFDYFARQVRAGVHPPEFLAWAETLGAFRFAALFDALVHREVEAGLAPPLDVKRLMEHFQQYGTTGETRRLQSAVLIDTLLTLAERRQPAPE